MSAKTFILPALAAVLLSACYPTSDAERALIGGAAGAVIADQTDNSVLGGAAIGAGAGILADDVGIVQGR